MTKVNEGENSIPGSDPVDASDNKQGQNFVDATEYRRVLNDLAERDNAKDAHIEEVRDILEAQAKLCLTNPNDEVNPVCRILQQSMINRETSKKK